MKNTQGDVLNTPSERSGKLCQREDKQLKKMT